MLIFFLSVHQTTPAVDVVAIDHLPSLVPYESSKEFGDALLPHLLVCDSSDVWVRGKQLFANKTEEIRENLKQVRPTVRDGETVELV